MGSNKMECCSEHQAKKTLMFGITALVVGLLMMKYAPEEVLVVIGAVLVLRSLVMMVARKD